MTLERDIVNTQDEILLDIYRKLHPGEPPARDAAQALLEGYYFNLKRYDLTRIDRYKTNKKFGLGLPFDNQVLTMKDIAMAIKYIVVPHEYKEELNSLPTEADNIDHFDNCRLRIVGELIQNQLRTSLGHMERVIRDHTTTQDIEAIIP